ncbi:MAG: tetratricopeptide repeat protein, partial [Syntrophaceae bacterium]|nr:tetratricopeptide repeat protein [Syntrophaceae bacterium]
GPNNLALNRLAVSPGGIIFLLDSENNKLYRVDFQGRLQEFTPRGVPENGYKRLEAICFGPQDLLFMTDSLGPSILALSFDGKRVQRFALAEHLLQHPTDLALHENDLWVVDEGKKAISHFSVKSASTGLDHALLGEEYLAANYANEAVKEFESAALLCNESSEIRLNWGQALYSLKDYNGALVQFKKAEALTPSAADPALWMGHAHMALGMAEDALKDYQKVLSMVPCHALAHYNLGLVYLSLGQPSPAETHLDRSLQLDPNDLAAKLGLGRVYLAQKKYGQARDIFASFAGNENLARQAHYYLGLEYLEEGRAREALPYLERSSREGPFFSDSFYALGNAHRALGDSDKAEKCYKKALQINPQNALASKALQEMDRQ